MKINGKEVVMPSGYRRKKQVPKKVRRHAVAHTGGYNESLIWLRGR